MMRRYPAGDQIERHLGEGNRFGWRHPERGIRNSRSFGPFPGLPQHPAGHVDSHNFGNQWRKVQRGESRSSGDVQQACIGVQTHGVEQGVGGQRGYRRKKA